MKIVINIINCSKKMNEKQKIILKFTLLLSYYRS